MADILLPTVTPAAIEEIQNIVANEPLWPGDTIMGSTARACVRLGWARHDERGYYVSTPAGREVVRAIAGGTRGQ